MARQATKRKQTPRPGLAQAARDLGCTLSHLRRCVIGERASRSLMNRYRTWKKQQRAAENAKPFPPSAAAEVARAATHLANNPIKS